MRATESLAVRPSTRLPRPVVIGHRGAPAYRPEHTAASFDLAIDLGAELIEPDVVVSRDGVLVVRHENELSISTDVATRSEFAARRTTKVVDDKPATGWFTEDFTLAELRTLRAVERMPEAPAAEHRLRRPLRHPHPRRGHRDRPSPLDGRPPDPRARRAQAHRERRRAGPADGRARHRGAPPARRHRRRGLRRPAVLRRRRPARPAHPAGRRRPADGAAGRRRRDGDRSGHPRGPARHLHLRPGDRAQPRARAAERRRSTSRPRRRSCTRRTGPSSRSSAGRCGRRTRSCPSTSAAGRRRALGDAIADAMALLDLGVDGLITDSPDHAVRAVKAPALRRWSTDGRGSGRGPRREVAEPPCEAVPTNGGRRLPEEGPATAQLTQPGRLLAAVLIRRINQSNR